MQLGPHQSQRVALFTDTFDEANGVATLSRNLAEFARRQGLPFFLVRGGDRNQWTREGVFETLVLERSAASFPLDTGLFFDPLLTRHRKLVTDQLRAFSPDLIHVTGPGDLGFLGLLTAHALRVPLVASWHTNLHEYLSRRLGNFLRFTPRRLRERTSCALERHSLRGLVRFYRTAHFVMAPNAAMVDLLHQRTGRPAFLMPHGVDLSRYSPCDSRNGDHSFCIGYVGRLTAEKNVRFFLELERRLLAAGEQNFKLLIVGEGGQRKWMQKHLQYAELPGVLRGEQLTSAYGRMDAFVFPSLTDTFGLVVLEAMACGVPVILASETGRRIGVEDGISGFLSADFVASVRRLMHDRELQKNMGEAARTFASSNSWQPVFEQLYKTYAAGLQTEDRRREEKEIRRQSRRQR